jgi:hypothetical protein
MRKATLQDPRGRGVARIVLKDDENKVGNLEDQAESFPKLSETAEIRATRIRKVLRL